MITQTIFTRTKAFFFTCASTFILSGCANMNLVPVSFNVSATPVINSSENEASLPVHLKIYQLTELSKFKDATFRELWKQDKQTLGDSLISINELTVTPKSQTKLKLDRQDKAKYIGIIAIFRHPELGQWRAYQRVSSQASSLLSSMSVTVKGNSVSMK